ncbi:hypothetical protein ACFSJS_21520 [Streptomyces desertarenae]|uniref:Uncharacterized protein n=1 Tax=Streptomyces desertarenae TaxID=2666184 RepID=A0ABW4PRS3_9ACTN
MAVQRAHDTVPATPAPAGVALGSDDGRCLRPDVVGVRRSFQPLF